MTIATPDTQWIPNYEAEFMRRLAWKNKLFEDVELQKAMELYYSHNCIAWINDWAVTFDPRAAKPKPRTMPFILFPRQREFITFNLGCLEDKEHGLTEKARDMGATWLCCAISVWLWLYWPGTVVGWGSLKEANVDRRGDMKAIFPKIRMILSYLPRFMLPAGFKMSVHATHMKIINPQNSASIIGEAGDEMGRGGRTSLYFKDESAHYTHSESVEAALGDNTDVQMDMSSVNGPGNVFYRRRMAGEVWYADKPSTPGKVRVFIFDWSENPLKSQAWYDARYKKALDEGLMHIFNQEVCRNYFASVERTVIPMEWIESSVDAHIKLGFTDEGERVAGQDVADGGQDKNALGIFYGVVLRFVDDWGGDPGDAARRAIPICRERKVTLLDYDSIGVGSGFKVEINNLKERQLIYKGLSVAPWNAGLPPLDPERSVIPGDKESATNEDTYENLKAQSWFRIRSCFYKTHRAVTAGVKYDPKELISLDSTIPKLNELKMQLAQAISKPSKRGKTMIDKKPEGTLSPNLAECVVMAKNPVRAKKGFFDV